MISVRMLRNWDYWLDAAGDSVRTLPSGKTFDLDDEVAAAAIADGSAEPLHELPDEIADKVSFYRRVLDMVGGGLSLEDAIAAVEAEEQDAAAKRKGPRSGSKKAG